MADKGKVTVSLEINAIVDNTDSGYLGLGESVHKHIHKAKTDAQAWRFLVQRGSLEPEEIRVRVNVVGVQIIPEQS